MTDVAKTLAERGSRYGSFEGHARITYDLKRAMQRSPNWPKLMDDQREALDMIAHKIGRVLNGDPDYADSWHDIAGYAKLVEDRLNIRLQPAAAACERKSAARTGNGARRYPPPVMRAVRTSATD